MTIWFVTRHPAAFEWARRQNIEARLLSHLEPAAIAPGDVVIGTLPLHLAAAIQARGARFLFLELDLPQALRGQELDIEAMLACAPRLVEYRVERLGPIQPADLAVLRHSPPEIEIDRTEAEIRRSDGRPWYVAVDPRSRAAWLVTFGPDGVLAGVDGHEDLFPLSMAFEDDVLPGGDWTAAPVPHPERHDGIYRSWRIRWR